MIEVTESKMMRKFPLFDLTRETWSHDGDSTEGMEVYRNKTGDMIDCRSRGKRPGIVKAIARMHVSAEKSKEEHCCCSIGKSAVDGKWYGWSHRAMVGFGKGNKVFDETWGMCAACKGDTPGIDTVRELHRAPPVSVGDGPVPLTEASGTGTYTHHENDPCQGGACATRDSTLFIKHGDKDIVTDKDARQAAINFAAYVS